MVYAQFENGKYMGYSMFLNANVDSNIEIREITETEARQLEMERSKLLDIRTRREDECFSIINRGQPWYARLTDIQKQEIDTWYQAWLDAPQTLIIPEKPNWLI